MARFFDCPARIQQGCAVLLILCKDFARIVVELCIGFTIVVLGLSRFLLDYVMVLLKLC